MLTLAEINELWEETEDGKLYWKTDIGTNKLKGVEAGTVRNDGYRCIVYKGKHYAVHRILFFKHHGYLPPQIDHKNGVKTDNRIDNLREATRSENGWNRTKNKNNSTGVKNVHIDSRSGKFSAEIRANNKKHRLGLFNTVEEAKKVVDKKRKELHKDFANNG